MNNPEYNTSLNLNDLPKEAPLFLVRGAILLPKAQLPLPIFSPNHLSSIAHAIKTGGHIGIVQPNTPFEAPIDLDELSLFSIGTLARISEISEIEEKKIVATVEGVSRFTLLEKFENADGLPFGRLSYDNFMGDIADEVDFTLDRPRLVSALRIYFNTLDIIPNWEEINETSNHKLINVLSMACPFGPSEKQALLESNTLKSQSELILSLIEMASLSGQTEITTIH